MAVLPLVGASTGHAEMMRAGRLAAGLLTAQVLLAFILLTISFLRSDFSLQLVASHSHSLKPLLYKISGVWGNHEGSLLLWVLILSAFSLMVASSRRIDRQRQARVLAVQGMIAVAFLLFVLLTSNPFLRLDAAPLDGNGLNPLLQDPGLAFHPPMLYVGYVGLSAAFSFAVAALIEGKVERDWAREARPFILIAWSALTMGIALGSWWAYYELGWGGWWFWDPVENASLMPWLIATALIHSMIAVEKQDSFKTWTILLAILGFSLSLLGTFIVRSGLLTSVHSFASDPARGMVILAILAVSIGGPLTLFALRGDRLSSRGDDGAMVSRESALIANNLLLVVAAGTVLIGTLYPLGLEAWNGARISVGPPFFNATFAPLMGLMVLLMAAGPLLAWHRADGLLALKRMIPALGLALIAAAITWLVTDRLSAAALATVGLALWLTGGIAADIAVSAGFPKGGLGLARKRLTALPLSRWGMNIAHLGVAVFILGAAGASFFESETIERAFPGDVLIAGEKTYRLEKVVPVTGPNYTSTAAILSLLDDERVIDEMVSEIRFYPVSGTTTTEAAIRPRLSGDAYAVLGEGDAERGYTLRLYDKPLVSWVWGGAGLMALGGFLAVWRRDDAEEVER
jgi:cytochrome c-type biogenesis protein CcmF